MHVARHSVSVMRVSLSKESMHCFMASGLSSWDFPKIAGPPPAPVLLVPAMPGLAALAGGDDPDRPDESVAGVPVAAARKGDCCSISRNVTYVSSSSPRRQALPVWCPPTLSTWRY